jgi:hypothetical protein
MTFRARHWRDRERYDVEGRFSDLEPATPTSERPVFTLRLQAEPGVEPIRQLRWALKMALRRYGFRCVYIRREPPL